jgi:hypothetical protein
VSGSLQRSVEKHEMVTEPEHIGSTLEQIVVGSLGLHPGPPATVHEPGETTLEYLIHCGLPVRIAE